MPKDRHFVGLPGCTGHWKKLGELQFSYLVGESLKPDHKLLDVGCGTFRGGRQLIDFLDKGHYYGIDRNANLLLWGIKKVLIPSKLILRNPTLYAVELGTKGVDLGQVLEHRAFDFIWAHAVFDHMRPDCIALALYDLSNVLDKKGSLYATVFIVDEEEKDLPHDWGSGKDIVTTYPDKEYWHYTAVFFGDIARKIGLELADCPEYDHPLGLSMLKFVRCDV